MSSVRNDAEAVMKEIFENISLEKGDIFVVGCSSSEVIGNRMGTSRDGETDSVVEDIYSVISEAVSSKGAFLAVQCCEHLNRALVLEREAAAKYDFEIVNVIPQPHAGGAFAVKHYSSLDKPAVVENIGAKAVAGLDIGGVLIGMHIKPVVVPVRLVQKTLGEAVVHAGKYRPKYIGGQRAVYE